jgi:hypothetical protein
VFYIIETAEQLEQFRGYNLEESFVEPILASDTVHPALSSVIAYLIKPSRSRTPFILPISHSETFSLSKEDVEGLIASKVAKVYTSDAKRTKYHLNLDCPVICLKTLQWLSDGTVLDDTKWNTTAHTFLYNKYPDKRDINKIVPICKHQEKWNNYLYDNKKLLASSIQNKKYFKFYNEMFTNTLLDLELAGIHIDADLLKQYYPEVNTAGMVYGDSLAYSHYNIHTSTGRPSNAFGGLNFGAMNKSDDSRSFITTQYTRLVEFDFNSYHPKMLCNLVGYEFEGSDIHSHLGRLYFDTDELTDQQYSESKNLTFKLLYTNADGYDHITFFQKVKAYKERLWKMYREKGYLEAIISKRPIIGIKSKTQILPYLLQSYETERNILLINEIQECLREKNTKLVLYSYDSFLLDFDANEGSAVLEDIEKILEVEDYKTSVAYGVNYSSMKKIK